MLFAIVEQGGLTEGAELLGKSQPSLSRSLAIVEKRVGMPLFEPDKRPLRPTEVGKALAAEGRKVFEAGQKTADILNRFRQGKTGAVRVGGTPFFLDGVVSGILAAFQFKQPDIRIDQIYGYASDLVPRLDDKTLDLAILPMRTASVLNHMTFEQILPGRNVIACRTGHPLLRRGAVRLSDIGKYPWIAPPADSPLYQDLHDVLKEIGIKDLKVSFTGGSLSATVNILTGSDALTVMPMSVVFMLRHQKSISPLSIRIGDPDRHLGILVHSETAEKPAVKRVITHIRDEFAALELSITRVSQDMVWRT